MIHKSLSIGFKYKEPRSSAHKHKNMHIWLKVSHQNVCVEIYPDGLLKFLCLTQNIKFKVKIGPGFFQCVSSKIWNFLRPAKFETWTRNRALYKVKKKLDSAKTIWGIFQTNQRNRTRFFFRLFIFKFLTEKFILESVDISLSYLK